MSKRPFVRGLLAISMTLSVGPAWAAPPRNVVFMVGDGMGLNHVAAAGMYLNGAAGTLCFESLPYQGQVTTYSASSSITDSAAAATAMATGHKVDNGVIAMATPGDGSELPSLLEFFKARGASTGLVTSDAMTGATPAGFGAHEPSRNNSSGIAGDYLNQTRPNVLLGGGGSGMSTSAAAAAGYTVVTNRTGLLGIDTNVVTMLSGQFGSGSMPYEYDGLGTLPHLSQMVTTALDILDNDPDGFFLLVESGNIDHAAHNNDLVRDVFETVQFNTTVQTVLDWAAGRTDTLVVITADHETGGMSVPVNNGQGNLPTVSWSTTGHSAANVGVWAQGFNAQYITGTLNNTDFYEIVTGPDPVIIISPLTLETSVDWARTPPPNLNSFTVRNGGGSTLEYTITSDAAWVWPSPDAGSCTTGTDTIWLSYNTASFAPGLYTAHLTVGSTTPGVEPQVLTLNLTVKPVPGDFNDDRDVDQEDFGFMQACLSMTVASGCEKANLLVDSRIDQNDFLIMQKCWSGPGTPASPACVQPPPTPPSGPPPE